MHTLLLALGLVTSSLFAASAAAPHTGEPVEKSPPVTAALSRELVQFCRDPKAAVCGADDIQRGSLQQKRAQRVARNQATLRKLLASAATDTKAVPGASHVTDADAAKKLRLLGAALDRAAAASNFSVASMGERIRARLLTALAAKPAFSQLATEPRDARIIASAKELDAELEFLRAHAEAIVVDGENVDPVKWFVDDLVDSCGEGMDADDATHTSYRYVPKHKKGEPATEAYREYVLLCPAEMVWAAKGKNRPEGRAGFIDEAMGKALSETLGADYYPKLYTPLFACLDAHREGYGSWEQPLDDDDKAERADLKTDEERAKWDQDRKEARQSLLSSATWNGEVLADGLRQQKDSRAKFRYLKDALAQYCTSNPFLVTLVGHSPSLRSAVSDNNGCGPYHPSEAFKGAVCGLDGEAPLKP